MSIKFNGNIQQRDKLIFGEYDEKAYGSGGVRYFDNLSLEVLKKLSALNFINPDDKQNDCPAVKEIVNFMEKYLNYTAHGYAVAKNKDSYRITITGVEKKGDLDNLDELKDFTDLFGHADELHAENLYCWFD